MRTATFLTLTSIAFTNAACSSYRSIAIHDASPGDSALTVESIRILERIECGDYAEARCELEQLSGSLRRQPGGDALQDLLSQWLEERHQALQTEQTQQTEETEPTEQTEQREQTEQTEQTDQTQVPEALGPALETSAAPPSVLPEKKPAELPRVYGPHLPAQEIEALKDRGMQLYSEGKVADALECWRRLLAAVPADEEAKKLIARAESVLLNQAAQ